MFRVKKRKIKIKTPTMKFESEEFTASLFPGYNFTTESEFIYNDLKLDSLLSPKTLVENLKESHDYETLKSTIKTKFTHHGKISLYKSKIQLSETKRLNELRNQVTFIKTSITSKTDLLNELEAQFLDQKNTYRKIISSLETTCFKITSRFDSNPFPFANSLKIAITCTSPFKNVVISCKELESIPDSLLKFQKITNNYVLNDAEIKKLYHEFDTLFDKLINLLHKIDEIEGLISSTSSDLSKCIHQEEKYSQVSRKINELDIIEGIEGIILNEIIKEQKLESKIIQKQARVQENHKLELEARQKEISDLQLKSRLDENWNKFQIRLHETLEKVYY